MSDLTYFRELPLGEILVLGLALAMDSFVVTLCLASNPRWGSLSAVVQMGIVFGTFQCGMPFVGWFCGNRLAKYVSGYDHWIAFFLLLAVGLHMMMNGKTDKPTEPRINRSLYLLSLGVATSIDALAVGAGLSFAKVSILRPAILVGLVTASVCIFGGLLSSLFSKLVPKYAEKFGGIMLIAIGLKILYDHLVGG